MLDTTKIINNYNENKIESNKILDDYNLGKYRLMKLNQNNDNKSKTNVLTNNKLIFIEEEFNDQRKINAQLKFNELKKEFKTNYTPNVELKKRVQLDENLDDFDQIPTVTKTKDKAGSKLAKNIYRCKSNEMMFFLNRKPESLKEHEKEIIDRVIEIKNKKYQNKMS